MVDNTSPLGAPGIASYGSETYGNTKELRLQDTPAIAVRNITITATGANLTLPLYAVVDEAGLAPFQAAVADKTALGVLTAPVELLDGQSMDIDVYCAGNFDFGALTFADSFGTDAAKKAAFDGLGSPMNIILGTNPYDSDGVLA